MPKSNHRKGHDKKVQQYRNMLKAHKEKDKRDFQKYLQAKQEEYLMKQQMENQPQVEVDQNLMEEVGDFKLDD